ncbi:hypothetical protein, partial [Paenibacillus dendritiformis]|uniref:hypothetical protein n=1 Tax=Paenibacillus dendritiformis TaxID=130049 RepID=UPI001BCF267E
IPESPVPILIFNVQAGNFEGILCSYKGLEKDSKLPLGNTIRGMNFMEKCHLQQDEIMILLSIKKENYIKLIR